MRAYVNFKLKKPLKLPIQYNHILQAVLLNSLNDEKYKKFIHDKGYEYEKRNYKMYTFSKLYGKFKLDKENKTITYYENGNFLVSSYDNIFLSYIINNIMLEGKINIAGNDIEIENIETKFIKINKNKMKVYTKSPITVYSTIKINGKNKTYYYSPYEEEFSELIRKNLLKKYQAFHGKKPNNDKFDIKILNKNKLKENIVIYKGLVIKAWSGEFLLEGSEELIDVAYNAGVGSKNSQGFGCLEEKNAK
ncbi:CRISPR associated protein Cas6 [Clostridium acetireducens DSM 10703]|uniref:CRISPR-associated endoribonuclease n=1 Tax=Clostridium acetireducens DSM 10703 TaxID=1121290 RepID=A0A1E8EWX7_9CLOT|nr:CRISPR-associated endoribonuclease Cas6 [Clostridium acetireducens]OFI05282.1 CRISPR associated protein Cas6 [Clostridium acetireducens DSM 10703]